MTIRDRPPKSARNYNRIVRRRLYIASRRPPLIIHGSRQYPISSLQTRQGKNSLLAVFLFVTLHAIISPSHRYTPPCPHARLGVPADIHSYIYFICIYCQASTLCARCELTRSWSMNHVFAAEMAQVTLLYWLITCFTLCIQNV